MKELSQIRRQLVDGEYEFSRHAFRRVVERNISEKEIAMFKCHVCGYNSARDEFVSEVFTIEDRRVLVEHIPAKVCDRCGEAIFSRETTEKIRKMVRKEAQPLRTIPLDVFALG